MRIRTYRIQSVLKNYHRRLRAKRTGEWREDASGAWRWESLMTGATLRDIEQQISLQIRRRLIKRALEE